MNRIHPRPILSVKLFFAFSDKAFYEYLFTRFITFLNTSDRTCTIASNVQELIWLEEKIKEDQTSSPMTYNRIIAVTITSGTFSVERIRSAICAIIDRQVIFRSAFLFNDKSGLFEQVAQPTKENAFSFQVTRQKQINVQTFMESEFTGQFVDLRRGRPLRCHLVQQSTCESDENHLYPNDIILFSFHPIVYDSTNISHFLNMFISAYDDPNAMSIFTGLQYNDYIMNKRRLTTESDSASRFNQARQFWSSVMDNYEQTNVIGSNKTSDSLGSKSSVEYYFFRFELEDQCCQVLQKFALARNVSVFHLGLASYFAFLFKLGNFQEDIEIIIASTTNIQPLADAFNSIVDPYTNILPYRIKLNPNDPFECLVEQIKELEGHMLEHASLPYQMIVGDRQLTYLYQYYSLQNFENKRGWESHDGIMSLYTDDMDWVHDRNNFALYDITFNISNTPINANTHYSLSFSSRSFNQDTAQTIANRFQRFFVNLFSFIADTKCRPISEISIVLPWEFNLIEKMSYTKNLSLIRNVTIPHALVTQSQNYPQKVSVELDEQSITYAELISSASHVVNHLLGDFKIQSRQVICQCVERSIEMVCTPYNFHTVVSSFILGGWNYRYHHYWGYLLSVVTERSTKLASTVNSRRRLPLDCCTLLNERELR